MRFYSRPALDKSLLRYLEKKQKEIRLFSDVQKTWDRARRTKKMKRIAEVLASMTGVRERCMYCEDSRATDIDHYRPKRLFINMVFVWENLLWTCALCNRLKAILFPLDDLGNPLLLNPILDDPWLHLVFDSTTAELSARWDGTSGVESLRGVATLTVLSSLGHQAVNEGRARTRRNLVRAVNTFMASTDETSALVELKQALADNDCYGLLEWFFLRDGQDEVPFRTMKKDRKAAWGAVLATLG